jgi:hypothetical protein
VSQEEKKQMGQLDNPQVQQRLAAEGVHISPATVAARHAENQDFIDRFGYQFREGRGLTPVTDADKQRDRLVKENWDRLLKVGWDTATVVNCMPWPVAVRMGFVANYIEVRPPAKGEMYHKHTLEVPFVDQRDLGDGKYMPSPVMPVEVAQEFERQYENEGGVFFFRGKDIDPALLAQLLDAAFKKMTGFMMHLHETALSNWQRFNHDPRQITDRMRDAARWLYERGHIDKLPEYVTATKAESLHSQCPACMETIRKGANVCRYCGFKINPDFAAQNAGRFDRTAPVVESPAAADAAPEATKPVIDEIDLSANEGDDLDEVPEPPKAKRGK